jgi:hypothetical protein
VAASRPLAAAQPFPVHIDERPLTPLDSGGHPLVENLLHKSQLEQHKDAPKSVLAGDAVGQFQKSGKPLLFSHAKIGDAFPPLSAGDNRTDGNNYNILKEMAFGLVTPGVRDVG